MHGGRLHGGATQTIELPKLEGWALTHGWVLAWENTVYVCILLLFLLSCPHSIPTLIPFLPSGPKSDPEAAKQFIMQMFLSVNPDPDNRRIFCYFTQATDAENMKRVFQDVREHLLEENLKDYNLM